MVGIVIIAADSDPVASRALERWGTPPATGDFVDGAAVRRLSEQTLLVRRPGPHIADERVDDRLPASVRAARPTLVFPSIHRGEQNVRCLTVHALGNPGADAELGGRPRTLVPTDPPLMTGYLRRLAERSGSVGWPVTFEATHHGPELTLPACFVEIGYGTDPGPPAEAVRLLAELLPDPLRDDGDRIALGIGGGHYAPHFTDLALRRRWAFGHLVSRHALAGTDRPTIEAAYRGTPGAEGILFARAADADHPTIAGVAPRLRDSAATPRATPDGGSTPGDRSSSGT